MPYLSMHPVITLGNNSKFVKPSIPKLSMASAISRQTDAEKHYNMEQARFVSHYAKKLANHLGLSQDEQHVISLAGLLFNIGKHPETEGYWTKEGKLSPDERKEMEGYPKRGAEELRQYLRKESNNEKLLSWLHEKGIELNPSLRTKIRIYLEQAAIMIEQHKFQVDRKGYPKPQMHSASDAGQIIGLIDAYGALINPRPYRTTGKSPAQAFKILSEEVGSKWKPHLVEALIHVFPELNHSKTLLDQRCRINQKRDEGVISINLKHVRVC